MIQMNQRKYNLIRCACRSLEVLLFFVISVIGFNLCAKTTSFNAKSKVRSLSGSPIAPRELSLSGITLHGNLNHLRCLFTSPQQQHTTLSPLSVDNHSSILHHRHLPLSYCNREQNQKNQPITSPLCKPGNLFQQNPILLI
jgi:hypothetical protein